MKIRDAAPVALFRGEQLAQSFEVVGAIKDGKTRKIFHANLKKN